MLSYTTLTNKCIAYSSDSGNKAFFQSAINEYAKIVENDLDDFIVEATRTGNTIATFNQIPTPANFLRFKFLYVLNGTLRYDAKVIYSEEAWQRIIAFQSVQSNYLEYAFPRVKTVELYPTPSSILPYTLQYIESQHDMQYDDYAAGTIASITNIVPTNALPYATVVGSSTVWQQYMAGMYFQMAGDKQWYQITGVTDNTHMTIMPAYEGIAISGFANTNYVIGEMPHLPEAAHKIPYYGAMMDYYEGPKKDTSKAAYFEKKYDKWAAWAKEVFSGRSEMGVIPNQRNLGRFNRRNPNLFPMSIG